MHADCSLQNKGSVPHHHHCRNGPSQRAAQPTPGGPSHGLRSRRNNSNKSSKHPKRSIGHGNYISNRANSQSSSPGGKHSPTVSVHTEITCGQNSLLQKDSAWTLPEPVQHILAIIYSPAFILTASGFSSNKTPAVWLGYLRAVLQPCISRSQRGFPSPGHTASHAAHAEKHPVTALTAQTP